MPLSSNSILTFTNDGGKAMLAAINAPQFPGIERTLTQYVGVIQETLQRLVKELAPHQLELKEQSAADEEEGSSFCLTIKTTSTYQLQEEREGEEKGAPSFSSTEVTVVTTTLDLEALLTAKAGLGGSLKEKVTLNVEGGLQFSDAMLSSRLDELLEKVSPLEMLQSSITEEQEQVLVDALASLAPALEEGEGEDEDHPLLDPLHPGDLLGLILAFAIEAISSGEAAGKVLKEAESWSRNPIKFLFRGVKGIVVETGYQVLRRVNQVKEAVLRIEDIAVGTAKFTLRLAKRSARPILVALIVNRALQTLEDSQDPIEQMGRMGSVDQANYYYSNLLGTDWEEQLHEDFVAATKEVQDGLLTDNYKDEKRLMTAAMLRELEVEEYHKQRMKHFYYGAYGLGPWYTEMASKLKNPYFRFTRGWRRSPENWVGKNKAFKDAVVRETDFDQAALSKVLSLKNQKLVAKLTDEQRARLLAGQRVGVKDVMLESKLLKKVLGGRDKLKKVLEKEVVENSD